MHSSVEHQCDVLIIGSGAAGLSLALKLAEHCQVIVLSKSDISEGSTKYAQGGIAAVFDESDSIDSHVEDTLNAGAGLCNKDAVYFTASRAKACMQWLIKFGMPFDQIANKEHDTASIETRFHVYYILLMRRGPLCSLPWWKQSNTTPTFICFNDITLSI